MGLGSSVEALHVGQSDLEWEREVTSKLSQRYTGRRLGAVSEGYQEEPSSGVGVQNPNPLQHNY